MPWLKSIENAYEEVYFSWSGSSGSCVVKVGGWHFAKKWEFSEREGLDIKGEYSYESKKLADLLSDEADLGKSGKHCFLQLS